MRYERQACQQSRERFMYVFCGHRSLPIPLLLELFILASTLSITAHAFQNTVSSNLDSKYVFLNQKQPYSFRSQSFRRQKISLIPMNVQNENSDKSDINGLLVSENLARYSEVDATMEGSEIIGGSVNDRLLAELQQAAALEKSGIRNPSLKENRLMKAASFFKSSKTDAERKAAIAEAQNLNGVNPVTTLFGSIFALLCAAGLWYATQSLAEYFALNPPDPNDAYFVVRVTSVSRNVVMGLSALASGFFGVTGFGILLLALRVGWGVITGELDPSPPTPTRSTTNSADNFELDNVWDLMLNKKPKRGPQ